MLTKQVICGLPVQPALVPRCPACSRPMGRLQPVAGEIDSRGKRRRRSGITYSCVHCNARLTVPAL
ncbi:MAG TPA: hypothetical protein VJK02_08065 [Anaerolineales bacterium]|jgi:hypothetical protein|nr:hypothetical protein [Anaerolineales bacterium]